VGAGYLYFSALVPLPSGDQWIGLVNDRTAIHGWAEIAGGPVFTEDTHVFREPDFIFPVDPNGSWPYGFTVLPD